MKGCGLVLPPRGFPPAEALELGILAERLGYGSLWAPELSGFDAVAMLAALAARTSSITLATGIVPIASRTPALLAMSAATLSSLAPGRVILGLGVSSRPIVEDWHGRVFGRRPTVGAREAIAIVRAALAGAITDHPGEQLRSHGFRLEYPPVPPPGIHLAALGPAMRGLACEQADGIVLNFLPLSAAPHLVAEMRARAPGLEIEAFVRVATGGAGQEWRLRRELASYLRVDSYRRWMRSLGHGDVVDALRSAEDLDGMARALPDDILAEVSAIGSAEQIAARLARYRDCGIMPLLLPSTAAGSPRELAGMLTELAPGRPDGPA